MQPFQFAIAANEQAAINTYIQQSKDGAGTSPSTAYLAGGTTLLDLMKLNVEAPQRVIDINALEQSRAGKIELGSDGLRLGALTRMSAVADHPRVRRDFPVIAESLQLAASAQLRNMAALGGNVLQRTRCTYFRDVSYANCNKRRPGSGCAALEGVNRNHAVLGASDHCIATYPGDFAQALIALDADLEILGPGGMRRLPFATLHRAPGQTPHLETTLAPGEIILAFVIPPTPWARRSLYLKIRDRESYEFALASAAVVLDLADDRVRQCRIALGGVATVPWRARAAEQAIAGQVLNEAILNAAADAAFEGATPRRHNGFKIELGKRTLVRALRQAAALEV